MATGQKAPRLAGARARRTHRRSSQGAAVSFQITELPIQPEPGGAVAVVLYQHDEPFNAAVRGWGLQWNTRVACWLASNQPYGIAIARAGVTSYERMFLAHDDASFEAAVVAALDHLDGARCRWRVPRALRSWVLSYVRDRQHRAQLEAQGAA
jgi:hypothetical protein